MQYMLLIYDEEKLWADMPKDEADRMFHDYMAFTESIKKSGHFIAGEALQSTRTATTLRVRGGKTLTTDGPFAETKEAFGGFYMIEAKDLDEALSIAARIPSARVGSIEVRAIQKF
jgi:hypothetical protein